MPGKGLQRRSLAVCRLLLVVASSGNSTSSNHVNVIMKRPGLAPLLLLLVLLAGLHVFGQDQSAPAAPSSAASLLDLQPDAEGKLSQEQMQRLIQKDDKPLSEKDAAKEEEKIQKVIDKRKNESEGDRRKRQEKEAK